MAKEIRLGISLFFSNASNSGIVNYVYNIISALNTLPDDKKPVLIVFHSEDAPIDYLKEIGYPKASFILFKWFSSNRIINAFYRLLWRITKKDYYIEFNYTSKVDVLYPYIEFVDVAFKHINHKIHWLVDFNNRAYPSHYPDGGEQMKNFQSSLTQRTDSIALSSESLLDELRFYYPHYKNKVHILRFACSMPDVSKIEMAALRYKFDLHQFYFMSPNQFWEHKNQLTLIEALHILKTKGLLNFQIVFTGSMEVNRGKGHILPKIVHAVKEYGLEKEVKFLGIIERNEQLVLMKHAEALIQPSLYEGWSTLVEEAKALNQKIILSDLPVHKEQDCANSYFFDPNSPIDLANQIQFVNQNKTEPKKVNYTNNVKQFGFDILSMLNDELNQKHYLSK